jgi:Protein of unknown function (DUF3298)
MKKLFLISLLILYSITLLKAQEWTDNYALNYSGKIGDYPIEMVLFINSDICSGYYYYPNSSIPVLFNGKIDKKNMSIYLETEVYYKERFIAPKEKFIGALSENNRKIVGTWIRDDNNEERKLQFELHPTEIEKSISFRNISIDSSYFPSFLNDIKVFDGTEIALYYQYNMLYPLENDKNSISYKLSKTFSNNSFIYGDKTAYLSQIAELSKKNYDEQMINFTDTTSFAWRTLHSGYFSLYRWYDNYETNISYIDKNYICISSNFYDYTGGAHGLYGSSGKTYIIDENRFMELSDLFYMQDTSILNTLFTEKLKEKFHITKEESLQEANFFIDYLYPTDNFLLTTDGIEFIYTIYEIGPYVMGEIVISFDYEELRIYLNEDFIKNCIFLYEI